MAKLLFSLGSVLIAIRVTGAVQITDIFTLQPGTTNGGSNAYLTQLDDYLEEAIFSIDTAQRAIALYEKPTAAQETNAMRVRMALSAWFGILMNDNPTGLKTIVKYPPASTFLHCDSTWLTEKQPSDTAMDFQGNPIVVNGKDIPISSVPSFKASVNSSLTTWYSGDNTNVRGYYFTPANGGGNYCSTQGNLGLTSTVRQLQVSTAGKAVAKNNANTNVILCPQSFTAANGPASYDAGMAAIIAGSTLETAVPRSSTLLHECFHVVNGPGKTGFNEGETGGGREYYGQAICQNLATTNAASAKKTPENYVFFISAMYYLFGNTLDGDSGNGVQFWDFTGGPDNAQGPITRP